MPLLPRRRSTLELLTSELRTREAERDSENIKEKIPEIQHHHDAAATKLDRQASIDECVPETRDDLHLHPSISPPIQPPNPATKRFSLLKFRHFSDSQLATRARLQAEQAQKPPLPRLPTTHAEGQVQAPVQSPVPTPAIVTTAPTLDFHDEKPVKKSKSRLSPFKRHSSKNHTGNLTASKKDLQQPERSILPWRKSQDTRRDQAKRLSVASAHTAPMLSPQTSPILEPLRNRSDSDRSSGHRSSGSAKGSSPRPGLFKLRGRSKPKSLFPLPVKIEPPPQYPDTAPATPRASTSAVSAKSFHVSPYRPRLSSSLARSQTEVPSTHHDDTFDTPRYNSFSRTSVPFAPRAYPLLRNDSSHSAPSPHSSPIGIPRRLGARDRASTMSTSGRASDDVTPPTPPTLSGSARNSTSTSGRGSLGNFLTLSRFRHGTDLNSFKDGHGSKSNSFAISRESFALPDRQEGETAAKYLERLQAAMSMTVIAGTLSKSGDPFYQTVLRSYTRRFAFFGEPIDMSLRKFLLEAELPKETQQVDRVIQAFADRYHECNPGIFLSADQAYIVAFSLMMLHTDAFNKNNKHKMQRSEYIRNLRGQDVSEEVLGCLYDNICYTPFIHFDEEFDLEADKLSAHKSKKAKLKGAMGESVKKPSGPVDPYSLIIDSKLDHLRPSIKDTITVEDPYTYKTAELESAKIQRTFKNTGILQIISARSRPAAFESQATVENPAEAKPGVVDIQVTKVGILWRKGTKKQKARSPWREWGVILTGAQLYFFKNVSWVKTLMHQHNTHQRHAVPPSPVVFKPALEDFRPDALLKIDEAVALLDSSYTKHKHAFALVRQGGEEEIFLADNEDEQNDWLTLINYAATFTSAGIRIRGFIGVTDGDFQSPGMKRLDSSGTVQSIKSLRASQSGYPTRMNPQLARQIMAMRRKQMIEKMAEADIKMADMSKKLESMLRNARHLQILAPIQPRSREVVIHATARMDAMLKWTRRDIWRTKCYKEILTMDALEDSDDVIAQAAKMRPLSMLADPSNKEPIVRDQLTATTSPPRTPTSPKVFGERTLSLSQTDMEDDVFKTPPESASKPQTPGDWKLPPIEFAPVHRRQGSFASTTASTASINPASATNLSSTSSVHDLGRRPSVATSDAKLRLSPMTPSLSSQKGRDESLTPTVTATSNSTSGRRPSDAMIAAAITPDSLTTKSKSNRRSLHRTLRDRQESGSIHKHRKGKESASTVRSEAEEVPADGTPGLERGQGRFIVHGKQASVVTFGADWSADDKIRLKQRPADASVETGTENVALESHPRDNSIVSSNDDTPQPTPDSEDTPTQSGKTDHAFFEDTETAQLDETTPTDFVSAPTSPTKSDRNSGIRHIDNDELRNLSVQNSTSVKQ
ncbi:hypothetical protein MBLNU457_6606t1 [Dothideomycetes sp. NU457]